MGHKLTRIYTDNWFRCLNPQVPYFMGRSLSEALLQRLTPRSIQMFRGGADFVPQGLFPVLDN